MRALSFLALILLHWTTAHGAVRDRPLPPKRFSVVSATFGLVNSDDSPAAGFRESTKVPLKEGQGYGWVILLDTSNDKVKWREEFTLPSAPQTWETGKSEGLFRVSKDRTTSITEREVQPEHGLIFNFWEVAPGDPKGRYVIRVFVEGTLVPIFEFDVE